MAAAGDVYIVVTVAVLSFPTLCLRLDLGLKCVSSSGFSYLLFFTDIELNKCYLTLHEDQIKKI